MTEDTKIAFKVGLGAMGIGVIAFGVLWGLETWRASSPVGASPADYGTFTDKDGNNYSSPPEIFNRRGNTAVSPGEIYDGKRLVPKLERNESFPKK